MALPGVLSSLLVLTMLTHSASKPSVKCLCNINHPEYYVLSCPSFSASPVGVIHSPVPQVYSIDNVPKTEHFCLEVYNGVVAPVPWKTVVVGSSIGYVYQDIGIALTMCPWNATVVHPKDVCNKTSTTNVPTSHTTTSSHTSGHVVSSSPHTPHHNGSVIKCLCNLNHHESFVMACPHFSSPPVGAVFAPNPSVQDVDHVPKTYSHCRPLYYGLRVQHPWQAVLVDSVIGYIYVDYGIQLTTCPFSVSTVNVENKCPGGSLPTTAAIGTHPTTAHTTSHGHPHHSTHPPLTSAPTIQVSSTTPPHTVRSLCVCNVNQPETYILSCPNVLSAPLGAMFPPNTPVQHVEDVPKSVVHCRPLYSGKQTTPPWEAVLIGSMVGYVLMDFGLQVTTCPWETHHNYGVQEMCSAGPVTTQAAIATTSTMGHKSTTSTTPATTRTTGTTVVITTPAPTTTTTTTTTRATTTTTMPPTTITTTVKIPTNGHLGSACDVEQASQDLEQRQPVGYLGTTCDNGLPGGTAVIYKYCPDYRQQTAWTSGAKVLDNCDTIKIGTPIAMFLGTQYFGKPGLFVSCSSNHTKIHILRQSCYYPMKMEIEEQLPNMYHVINL